MKKLPVSILYGSVVITMALFFSGCQLFGPKNGEVSEEGSTIEVVPVTPSEEFAEVKESDVETVDLSQPKEETETNQSSLTGALRYYISEGKVLFSVAAGQDRLGTEDEEDENSSRLTVWVKGAQTAWQRVCDLTQDKGGLQCGGSLSEDQLPLEVGVVRGSGSPATGAVLLLQGRIPTSDSTESSESVKSAE